MKVPVNKQFFESLKKLTKCILYSNTFQRSIIKTASNEIIRKVKHHTTTIIIRLYTR